MLDETEATDGMQIRQRETGRLIITVREPTSTQLEYIARTSQLPYGVDKGSLSYVRFRDSPPPGWERRAADLRGIEQWGMDLRGADLRGSDLRKARLQVVDLGDVVLAGANLFGSEFICVTMCGANVRAANMIQARLDGARWSNTDLRSVRLTGSRFFFSRVHDCDMRDADLTQAFVQGTSLRGTNLAGVTLDRTVFLDCHDLHEAVGLDAVRSGEGCALDSTTLRESGTKLPTAFLRAVGFDDACIDAIRRGELWAPD